MSIELSDSDVQSAAVDGSYMFVALRMNSTRLSALRVTLAHGETDVTVMSGMCEGRHVSMTVRLSDAGEARIEWGHVFNAEMAQDE